MCIRKALPDVRGFILVIRGEWPNTDYTDKILTVVVLPTLGLVYLLAAYKLMFLLEIWDWEKIDEILDEI